MIQQFMQNNLTIIPSYAPTLLYLKLSVENINESKIMDLISAGYIALTDSIRRYKIKALLLSLADLNSNITIFNKFSRDLFLLAKIYNVHIVLDSGCLEYFMVSRDHIDHIGLSSEIEDPYINLKNQLKFLPNIAILPDRPNDVEENIKILYMREIEHLLSEAKKKGTKLAYVIHGIYPLSEFYGNLMKVLKSPLLSYIDYICIPEKELNMYKKDEIIKLISFTSNRLSKKLAILGLKFMSKDKLSTYKKLNIQWCDTIKWNHKVLRLLKGSVVYDDIQTTAFLDLISILKSNLNIISELVNIIGRAINTN